MIDMAISPLKEHFRSLKDPRAQHSIDHLLLNMVLVTICAVICGADTWGEIENYGIAKQEWLKTFLELPFFHVVKTTKEVGTVVGLWHLTMDCQRQQWLYLLMLD